MPPYDWIVFLIEFIDYYYHYYHHEILFFSLLSLNRRSGYITIYDKEKEIDRINEFIE